jgi:hypothetical protein
MTAAGGLPACSSSGDGDEASAEPTPWQQELANLEPDGSRSLDSALRLFAMAFGPMPGVPSQPRPQEFISASDAALALQVHEADLTPEQRDAMEAALRPPPGAIERTVPPVGELPLASSTGGGRGRRLSRPAAPPTVPPARLVASMMTVFKLAREQLAARLGYDFTGPHVVFFGPAGKNNYAVTEGHWDGVGPAGCSTLVNLEMSDASILAHVIYHETFHCFQHTTHATVASRVGAYGNNGWVWEGSIVWGVNELLGPDVNTPSSWALWLTSPERSLFAHRYDAIGFFAHLAETGTNPWSVMPAMFRQTSSDGAFAASGAGDAFLDSWASGYLRDRRLGKAWDFTGTGITRHGVNPTRVSIGKNESRQFHADPYTNDQLALNVDAEVLEVQVTGHGRVADGRRDYVVKGGRQFCLKGECKCPDEKQHVDKLASESSFAITGGRVGTSVTLTGRKFDEESCKKKATSPRGRNLGVVVTRPAYDAEFYIQALDVIDLQACNGVRGQWKGVLRAGGFGIAGAADAQVEEVPVSFTVDRRGRGRIQARVTSTVVTPVNQGQAGTNVDIAVQVARDGKHISLNGNFFQDLGLTNRPIARTAGSWC